jgi:hypothetical protein
MNATEGYVYVPDSDPGVFAGAARGMVVRKPDRSPPWIVVGGISTGDGMNSLTSDQAKCSSLLEAFAIAA